MLLLRVRGGALCMAEISLHLSQGFSTLHDIYAFRCRFVEFSDDLTGNKRLIVLIIISMKGIIPASTHEKTYNLAGVLMTCIYRKFLSINVLHPMSVTKSSAKLSDK